MGIIVKELRECRGALKIIKKKEMIKPVKKLERVCKETEELNCNPCKKYYYHQKKQ